jgi:hypothetical protein
MWTSIICDNFVKQSIGVYTLRCKVLELLVDLHRSPRVVREWALATIAIAIEIGSLPLEGRTAVYLPYRRDGTFSRPCRNTGTAFDRSRGDTP